MSGELEAPLMEWGSPRAWPARTVGGLALAGIVLLGLLVRLVEPLSNPVLPAEDPFTHMVRLKSHLQAGAFEARTPTGNVYPPGMHALLAAVWAFTGGDLYTLFRFAPAALGAIGILGVGLLLWRDAGIVAALLGALAVAIAPEFAFRTSMMAPTAVDLAVLGFLFYALLELVAGRMAWAGVAGALLAFLLFAHPWVLGIVTAAGVAFAFLAFAIPWPSSRAQRLSPRGFTVAMALVGVAFGLVLSTCGGLCGPGFQEVVELEGLQLVSPLVLVLALLPAAFLAVRGDALDSSWESPEGTRSTGLRLALSLALAIFAGGLLAAGLSTGLPEFVDPVRMLGWPLIVFAGLAFLAVPFIADPLSYLGAGLALATLPLVFFDLFEGFVAHRAVVFLGLAFVVLMGALAGAAASAIGTRLRSASGSPEHRSRWALGLVPALLVAGTFGAGIAAGTPEPYPEGWYRLYEPCEMDALRDVADRVGDEEATIVITGDWRPGIVLPALASPEPRIWYHEAFFQDPDERETLVHDAATKLGTLYLVEDRHLRHQQEPDKRAFLEEDHWRVEQSWCRQEVGTLHQVNLYVHTRTL